MTMRASSSCGAAALSTVRPGSSKSSAQNVQFHRRGTRSAAARLRRTAARLTRFAAPAAQAAEADSESDFAEILDFCQDDQGPSTPGAPTAACGPGPSSGDLFARGDGSLRGAFGTIFNVESCSPRAGDDNANVSAGICDNSSPGRSSQSGPTTQSISDNFCVFHLNVQLLKLLKLLARARTPSVFVSTRDWHAHSACSCCIVFALARHGSIDVKVQQGSYSCNCEVQPHSSRGRVRHVRGRASQWGRVPPVSEM